MLASLCSLLTSQRRSGFLFILILAAILLVGPSKVTAQHYVQTNLVSDIHGLAITQDTHLVNAWGLAHLAGGPWWVANNGN